MTPDPTRELKDADYWIEKLDLIEHPEGGYYREVYRSPELISGEALPGRYMGARALSTSIYFVLKGDQFSHLHRLKSDELWHFYTGSPLTIHIIDETGGYRTVTLGSAADRGEVWQAVIQAGWWFGATVNDRGAFSLVGCTVAPGFDFADFEPGDRQELMKRYPEHRSVIGRLTR